MNQIEKRHEASNLNIRKKQLDSPEQIRVLQELANSVAKPGCIFLEVGSWCGDSAIILGNIAKKYHGHLFCVDWWKGNVGSDLVEIATRVDIFSLFWKRIVDAGLEDVVIPIRGESGSASKILKNNSFDLIFIDADHRYINIKKDIQNYVPLVSRTTGMICGHDCEGRIPDYEMSFLNSGKNVDFFESVHCGVVLAVGEYFKDYSINYGIWSVQATKEGNWTKTDLSSSGIKNQRQLLPPPIGFSKNYLVYRYGKQIYAVPRTLNNFDFSNLNEGNESGVYISESTESLDQNLNEKIIYTSPPVLIETYKHYNLVKFNNQIIALSATLGPMDITSIESKELTEYCENLIFIDTSIANIKMKLDTFVPDPPQLIEEGYCGFNIVNYKGTFYGITQSLGSMDLTKTDYAVLESYQQSNTVILEKTLLATKSKAQQFFTQTLSNEISHQITSIHQLNEDIQGKDLTIQKLKEDIQGRDLTIQKLNDYNKDLVKTLKIKCDELTLKERSICHIQNELDIIKSTKWYRFMKRFN